MANKLTIWDHDSKQRAMSAVAALNTEKKWTMTLAPKTEGRTLSQSGLYHHWVDTIAKHLGYDHAEMGQTLMKHLIAPTKIVKMVDGTDDPRWSTTHMDVPQMAAYMDAVSRWAASEGIILRMPEDQHLESR